MYVKINIKIHFGRLKNCQISSTNIKICVFEVKELKEYSNNRIVYMWGTCVYLTINSTAIKCAEYSSVHPIPSSPGDLFTQKSCLCRVGKQSLHPAAFLDLMNQSLTCTRSADWHLNLVTTNMVMCHRAVCIPDIRC